LNRFNKEAEMTFMPIAATIVRQRMESPLSRRKPTPPTRTRVARLLRTG
jgi:hypothetical protein